jgi:hypothetical protein
MQNYNFICGSVWVWNLVSDIKRGILTLGGITTRPHWCTGLEVYAELVFLRDFFRQNGYNDRQIQGILNRRPTINQIQSPSCPMLGLHSTESAECCPGTT